MNTKQGMLTAMTTLENACLSCRVKGVGFRVGSAGIWMPDCLLNLPSSPVWNARNPEIPIPFLKEYTLRS